LDQIGGRAAEGRVEKHAVPDADSLRGVYRVYRRGVLIRERHAKRIAPSREFPAQEVTIEVDVGAARFDDLELHGAALRAKRFGHHEIAKLLVNPWKIAFGRLGGLGRFTALGRPRVSK